MNRSGTAEAGSISTKRPASPGRHKVAFALVVAPYPSPGDDATSRTTDGDSRMRAIRGRLRLAATMTNAVSTSFTEVRILADSDIALCWVKSRQKLAIFKATNVFARTTDYQRPEQEMSGRIIAWGFLAVILLSHLSITFP